MDVRMGESRDRGILLAPLYAPGHKFTTRSIAKQVGTSQSSVTRVWRAAFENGGATPVTEKAAELAGTFIGRDCTLLALDTSPEPGGGTARRPSLRTRNAVRTILVGDLLGHLAPEDPEAVATFASQVVNRTGTPSLTFLSKGLPPAALQQHAARNGYAVQVVEQGDWLHQLARLSQMLSGSMSERAVAAQVATREWARDPASPLAWVPEAEPSKVHRPVTTGFQAPGERTAEWVMGSIQEWLITGRFGAGDRITESFVSRTLRLSRGQVRDALTVLAADGMLDFQPNRGASIPRPTAEDVLETYAVRRALGTLIVQRLATRPDAELEPLGAALNEVLDAAATGDVHSTGDADLALQNTMAGLTGMKRIPKIFWKSTVQLRLFVSVMGLDYGYSSSAIVADNSQLVQAILQHDDAAAGEIWRAKMQDAATYMVRQLGDGGR